MRLPRVRFTVRRMMVAVGVVALILGAVVLVERRRDRFRRLAHHYSLQEHAFDGPRITGDDYRRDPSIFKKLNDARDSFRRGSAPRPITRDDPSLAFIKKYVRASDLDRRDPYFRGKHSEHYRRLQAKYLYAQRYPWLPVAPDPPPPAPPPP